MPYPRSLKKQRSLTAFGLVTFFLAVAAILVRINDASHVSGDFKARPMFEAFGGQINQVTRISIHSAQDQFDIVARDGSTWVLPSKADYPADEATVRQLLLAIKDLMLIDRKTVRPDYYEAIGLDPPDKGGNGVEISIFGSGEVPFADFVVGKRQFRSGMEDAFYVRAVDNPRSYLARGRIEVKPAAVDWLDTHFVPFEKVDMQAVSIATAQGPEYTISRDKPGSTNLRLSPGPGEKKVASDFDLRSVFNGLVEFKMEDVAPREDDGPGKRAEFAGHAEYVLAGGVKIGCDFLKADDGYWAVFSVEAAGSADPQMVAKVAAFEARAKVWRFALTRGMYGQMVKPYDEMLQEQTPGLLAPSLEGTQNAPSGNSGAGPGVFDQFQ